MHKEIVALTLLATLLVGSPGFVFAFRLGEIEINSALNQAMDAEIDLVGFSAATIDEVQVELASQQMFERVGVPRPYILTRLKFTPMISNGKPVIKVTSTDAIREPFLAFLIDVHWAKGKLLREYTVLLDPPVFGGNTRVTIQAPKVAAQPAAVAKKPVPKLRTATKTPALRVPTPSLRPTQAAVPSTVALKKIQSRPVGRGDTLWSIAELYAHENGVSVNQMMLAIHAANPQGFVKNNINNLKSGVVLRIPADVEPRYSVREALAEVRRQRQVWKQSTPFDSSEVNVDAVDIADDETMGTPELLKQEQSKTIDSSLSILGGDVVDGKTGGDANAKLKKLHKQVNLLTENSKSKGQENAELKGRIESLESMLKKQEDIISLQNEQLAQLQNTLATKSPDLAGQSSAEVLAAEMEVKFKHSIKAATVEPLPDFSGPIPEEFLVAEQQADVAQPESLVAEVAPKVLAEVVPVESVVEVSFVEKIVAVLKDQSKTVIYAGIALVALLLGWLGIKRRNAKLENIDLEANDLPAFEEELSFDETVIATPDSIDESLDVLGTVNAQSEASLGVDDVLAEADVYISYELYQQAEDLLRDGLAKEPDNAKYQVKLAEIYYKDKKPSEFVQYAEAMQPIMDKQSPEWNKIASMGAALAPAHELFAGANDEPEAVESIKSDDINNFNMTSENMKDFDLDDNSLEFIFYDDGELSDEVSEKLEDTIAEKTEAFAADTDEDSLGEPSIATLESGLDFNSESDDETLIFDPDDIDLDGMEEDSLPTLKTSGASEPDLDFEGSNEDLASETGAFKKDMLVDNVTEQSDVGSIDSTVTSPDEFTADFEDPSVIEEVGTKLDLARAFVDMGDVDAAKETLVEVIEQGDQTQIQQAKDLLDKLN